MQKFKTLDDVIALATFAHRNQTDKAGMPYIQHPIRVMESVQRQGALPYVQMAAVLHDITEDTPFTSEMLIALGVPEAAVRLVTLLDRNVSRQKYNNSIKADMKFIEWFPDADDYYYKQIRDCPEAKMIKLADIDDNTQTWRLVYLPEDTQDRLKIKYSKAKTKLLYRTLY